LRKDFLHFSPPYLGPEEIGEVVAALESGWITTGPRTKQFEQEFAAYVGAPAAMALSSCTAALHTALVLAGIGPGDEVITTPMTFAATVAVIEHVGATPVLVDVEPDTLNIDPQLVAAAVTERTRAVIPVHYGGHPCEMDALRQICRRHDLWLIEDAAHALPTRYRGKMVGADDGTGKNMVAYSFYATKNLTTAEGGMLTGPAPLMEKAQIISLHGMDKDAWKRNTAEGNWRYDVVMPGFKYNFTDIQAAIGLKQLERLEEMDRRRRLAVEHYHSGLAPLGFLDLPVEREECRSAWHLYPVRLRPDHLSIDRDSFLDEMKARNIGTSVHFIPVHTFSYYRDKYSFPDESFPVVMRESERVMSLPLHPGLTEEDLNDVVAAVRDIGRRFRR
jgi:dTDP-4-amino-4,6-dideoxygalactose transaminase